MPNTETQSQPDLKWFPQTREFIRWAGQPLRAFFETVGFGVIDTTKMLRLSVMGHIGWRNLLQQLAFVGTGSLPVSLLLCGTVGAVLSMQVAKEMANQGGEAYVGALVAMAMVRELGPIMTGFSVIAMAGSAFAAEITVMKSNSQMDALKVLQVSATRYLMQPRVFATILMLPLLAVVGTILGILAGMFAAGIIADIPNSTYLDSVKGFLELKDVGILLLKAAIFGLMISVLCCSIGFASSRKTSQSAESVTRAVVWSFIAMVLADYFLSALFY